MKSNASQTFVNKLTLNNVTLFDSWLSDQYDHAQETFFDLKQSVSYISNHKVNTGNYLLVSSMYLDETEVTYKRNVLTVSYVLSLTGGLMSFITSMLNLLLGSLERQMFLTSI